ncbi:hypothetical protein [Acuticoccus kandeliae]|uniref:hypothetical protein n=1 Tax=Acuticoccus kandeliae TaxID=2073160 RepID=UPI000D3E143B|nr:hypothetical protein [Acuticoccus kandeliae]
MSALALNLLALAAAVAVLRSVVASPVGYIKVPFLAGAILLAWFVPQAVATARAQSAVPAEGMVTLNLVALFSFLGMVAGWTIERPRRAGRGPGEAALRAALARADEGRLFLTVAVFVLFALGIQILIQLQPAAALTARQPSGPITILRLFASLNPVAFVLAFAYLLLRVHVVSVTLFLLSLLTFAAPILLAFKRSEIVELGLAGAYCLWAMRRLALPRLALPVLVIGGLVVLFGVSEMRTRGGYVAAASGGLSRQLPSMTELAAVDWPSVVTAKLGTVTDEYRNGAYFLASIQEEDTLGLGRMLWNKAVRSWVPAQIVGDEAKRALITDLPSFEDALDAEGAVWKTGTTVTGFPDAYLDWDVLSLFVFALSGWIAARAYHRGLAGDLSEAAIYPSLAALCVSAFTHSAYALVMAMPLLLAARAGIRIGLGTQRAGPPPRRRRPLPNAILSAERPITLGTRP